MCGGVASGPLSGASQRGLDRVCRIGPADPSRHKRIAPCRSTEGLWVATMPLRSRPTLRGGFARNSSARVQPRGAVQPGRLRAALLRLPAAGDNVGMKTQGEIEAAVCEGIRRFEQDYMGRGPKEIHAHLLGDLLVVRLLGVLTAAEQHLAKSLPGAKGRDLLKQVRTHLIETARPLMDAMIHGVTGVKVVSLHHDISTTTGEEVVLFTLAGSPVFREAQRK